MQYEDQLAKEVKDWQRKMSRRPGILNSLSRSAQKKINSYIPDKIHAAVTGTIKQMIRAVLFGAQHITKEPVLLPLQETEEKVERLISQYKHTAAAEGGIVGAGGFLLGLAELPVLMGIKIKMLFDIGSLYGYPVKDYKERIYILHIFQLAFSSQQHRREVYAQMNNWEEQKKHLPDDIHQFNWRSFQQEYRDYIDLAKLAQLIPGIGAVVGFVVNYKLLQKLGVTAMNAYRLRRLKEQGML